ncbi:MAG: ABC transporter permease [Desulfitobacteriaceae bacterium]
MEGNKVELTEDLFEPIGKDLKQADAIVRPSLTYWQDAWMRLKKHKLAMTGLVIIGILIVLAIVGPYLNPFDYHENHLDKTYTPPGSEYWFGSDSLGRDLFTRIWYGARISLSIGIVTALITFVVGVFYGGISGLIGGRVDNIMMRIVEILWGIPFLLYVILLMIVLEPGLKTIFIALGAVYWLRMARIVRGQVLSLKNQEYVLAAKALGASNWRILTRHLIPNAMGPIIVEVTLSVPEAIFSEAFLSFLGLGVSVPMASWGVLANEGIGAYRSYPWLITFPAFFISLTMLAFNFLGDGLRDALDPKMRK